MEFRMQDRMELKALVDFYATESDKNNQDCYVEIFRPDIKLDVYFGDKLGITAEMWKWGKAEHIADVRKGVAESRPLVAYT